MLTVLLVDDSRVVRKLGGKALASLFVVLAAADGESALRMFRRNATKIDVVLLDVELGLGLSGADVFERIREIAPATPVIVTTAMPPDEIPPVLRLADGFVAKPWTRREVMQEIEAVSQGSGKCQTKSQI